MTRFQGDLGRLRTVVQAIDPRPIDSELASSYAQQISAAAACLPKLKEGRRRIDAAADRVVREIGERRLAWTLHRELGLPVDLRDRADADLEVLAAVDQVLRRRDAEGIERIDTVYGIPMEQVMRTLDAMGAPRNEQDITDPLLAERCQRVADWVLADLGEPLAARIGIVASRPVLVPPPGKIVMSSGSSLV